MLQVLNFLSVPSHFVEAVEHTCFFPDIKIFGELLYVKHVELFFLITLVLFVTLIGSLVLSLCYYKPTSSKDFIKN